MAVIGIVIVSFESQANGLSHIIEVSVMLVVTEESQGCESQRSTTPSLSSSSSK